MSQADLRECVGTRRELRQGDFLGRLADGSLAFQRSNSARGSQSVAPTVAGV